MSVYLVTYDLRNEENSHDYGPLIKDLKRLKAQKVLKSVWLVNVEDTVDHNVLRDHFRRFLDSDDGLFITRLHAREQAAYKPLNGTAEWLQTNLRS